MHASKESLSPTTFKLTILGDEADLAVTKQAVLTKLSRNVKVPGFRPGKAPAHLVEKQLDQSLLQTEFLEQAVNALYVRALQEQNVRPATPPEITITKFVPFTLLEFTAEVEAIGEVKLADYKKIKLDATPVKVTAADVNDLIENLRTRGAERKEVTRAAKQGDELLIDFRGVDAKSKKPISGADGKAYPLVLGSQSFIPGFEDNLIGAKAGETKTFDITFPAEYGVSALQKKKVTFTVTVQKVQELVKPKLDDDFATKVGPFKSVEDMKADIKRQLTAEREAEAQRAYDNELLEKIAAKSEVAIPKALVEEEIDRIEEEEKRNVIYRGQTWQEHLADEGLSAEEHREKNRPAAELRVKAGLLLGQIAEAEQIDVTPEEVDVRMQLLRGQYSDPAMQAELAKPEARRDIASRMMTEKTLDVLRAYATKK